MQIIDGKKIAAEIEAELKQKLAALPKAPRLAIVVINPDHRSKQYVELKLTKAAELGINADVHDWSGQDLESCLAKMRELADDNSVHGIIVQLPAPGLEIQKVLDLMRKNIKISDINSNLISAARVGIFSHANWIVGAPGEDIQAMAHSLNLVWNHRARIRGLSPGVTLGDSVQTDYEFNRGRYNMSDWDKTFLGKWWSLDWSNTKIHRFIRLKYFYIWLKICKQHGIIDNNQARASIDEHYTVKFSQEKFTVDEVLYEDRL